MIAPHETACGAANVTPIDFSNHPCFSKDAHKKYGRVHLPVAPRCNIQCNFCNRKYDCMNESRPGVTSTVLTPQQALAYLSDVVARRPEISVMGIAGPGDRTGFFRKNSVGLPQVALWGETANDTRETVEHYLKDEKGLSSFLKMCWR